VESAAVIVVGGGPVGLALGCRLAQLGVPFVLLERRTERHRHSRSIGIHPPALALLDTVGVAAEMIALGVRVTGGCVFSGRRPLGRITFDRLPGPYPFVLTLPQHRTEAILERRLLALAPEALLRGHEVVGLDQEGDGVTVRSLADGVERSWRAPLVVGCDGARGAVRRALAVATDGGPYPDSYLMGDFADSTDLGSDAGVYLAREGVVEAFPLPGGVRRWVVRTAERIEVPSAEGLVEIVARRTGVRVDSASNSMLSAFGVERRLARRFALGRVALAGDAAHLISPIGGQGMNLGWLDVADLAATLAALPQQVGDAPDALARYAKRRRGAARRAAFRAESNMRLGRPLRATARRDVLLRIALRRPFDRYAARFFTMGPLWGRSLGVAPHGADA
jgi:2-polyprenyl-6-methoxyphenol hydroxylase-like FAD-dependent oxidoreductase